MKIRLLAVATLMLLLQPLAATAQELGTRELKRIQKQADRAFKGGQLESAAELYEKILAGTTTGDRRRVDALYGLAIVHLSHGADRDVETAREHLDELASISRHTRKLEVAATRMLLSEIDAARREIARHDAELAEKTAALDEERQRMEAERQALAARSQSPGGRRVKSLEAQLRKLRAELSEKESELAKKDVDLQKLKDALVGRAGG